MNTRLPILLAAVGVLTGCATFTTLQTPQTLGKGERLVTLAVSADRPPSYHPYHSDDYFTGTPGLEASARVGLGNATEVGLKVWAISRVSSESFAPPLPGGFLLDGKYQLLDTRFVDLSVSLGLGSSYDLSFSAGLVGGAFVSSAPFPIRPGAQGLVLLGINPHERVTLALTPKVGTYLTDTYGAGVLVGASAGLVLKVHPRFWLAPELTFVMNPLGDPERGHWTGAIAAHLPMQ